MIKELLSREEIYSLMEKGTGVCVSLYMPAHRDPSGMQADQIRYKNLLRKAQGELESQGVREAKTMLADADSVMIDNQFWNEMSDGLAMFINKDKTMYFRLPIQFEEQVVVSDRFYIKPMLPMLTDDGQFYVLAISENKVRFYGCTRYTIQEIELEDMPKSLEEALPLLDPEESLQWHSRVQSNTRGDRGAMFHGQGSGRDKHKERLQLFLKYVENAVSKYLVKQQTPLIVAGVEYYLPLYREVNHYHHLREEGITGNADRMSVEELREDGWKIVEKLYHKQFEDAGNRLQQFMGTKRASKDLSEVVRAAYQGRIDVLMVDREAYLWGRYDPNNDEVKIHEQQQLGDEDLLNYAAAMTLLKDGRVYALHRSELPADSQIAAVFRY